MLKSLPSSVLTGSRKWRCLISVLCTLNMIRANLVPVATFFSSTSYVQSRNNLSLRKWLFALMLLWNMSMLMLLTRNLFSKFFWKISLDSRSQPALATHQSTTPEKSSPSVTWSRCD